MKSHAQFALCLLTVTIIPACSLPVCEKGDVECRYFVKTDIPNCLTDCAPNSGKGCSHKTCLCSSTDDPTYCKEFKTTEQTVRACDIYICEDNEFKKASIPTCSSGFDGESSCNPSNNDEEESCKFGQDSAGNCYPTDCTYGRDQTSGECNPDPCQFGRDEAGQCNSDPCQFGRDGAGECNPDPCQFGRDEAGQCNPDPCQYGRNQAGECKPNPADCKYGVDAQTGECLPKPECIDGYESVQDGDRQVKAYCIRTVEDLKKLGQKMTDNPDNAYILMDDLQISGTWNAVDFSNGLLLGNHKTITLAVPSGLLDELSGSEVKDLNLVYDYASELQNIDDFGLLANTSTESTISGLTLNTVKPLNFLVSDAIYGGSVGGLIGMAHTNTIIEDVKLNVSITAKTLGPAYERFVGGLVGYSNDASSIRNIQLLDENSHIEVTGTANVGGLIGVVIASSSFVFDNSDVPADKLKTRVSGRKNVGGIIGGLSSSREGSFYIQNIKVGSTELTLLPSDRSCILEETQEHGLSIQSIDQSFEGGEKLNFGGIAGSIIASGSLLKNIELQDVKLITADSNATGKFPCFSGYVGGIAGSIDEAHLSQIHVGSMEFDEKTSWIYGIGGIAGYGNAFNLSDFSVDSFMYTAPGHGDFEYDDFDNDTHAFGRGGYGFGFYIGGVAGILSYATLKNGTVGENGIFINNPTMEIGGLAGMSSGSIFSDIIVSNVHFIHSSGWSFGGLIGRSNSETFRNVEVNPLILTSEDDDVRQNRSGGLIGSLDGSILDMKDSKAKSYVRSGKFGGLIGNIYNASLAITNSIAENYFLADSSEDQLGGLIGSISGNASGTYSRCSSYNIVNKNGFNPTVSSGIANTGSSSNVRSNRMMFYQNLFSLTNNDYTVEAHNSSVTWDSNYECCEDGAYNCNACADSSVANGTRYLIAAKQKCDGEAFYNSFKEAFCGNSLSSGITSCDAHKTEIVSSLSTMLINLPASYDRAASVICQTPDNSDTGKPVCDKGEMLCISTPASTLATQTCTEREPQALCTNDNNEQARCYKVMKPSFCN